MKIFLVGGTVRDQILGQTPNDRDFVVMDSTTEQFLKQFPKAKIVGKKLPVFLLGRDQYTLSPARTIAQDLTTRDLTINSLAQDQAGRIFAHPLALADLKNKILRPISLKNFRTDPLRIFRAARFLAQWPEFVPHLSLIAISKKIAQKKHLMHNIAPERIGQELLKALNSPLPSRFFLFLNQAQALSPWFAELKQAKNIPAGPPKYHGESSLFRHLLMTMDKLASDKFLHFKQNSRQDELCSNLDKDTHTDIDQQLASKAINHGLFVWMALCHDLGKISTPTKQLPRHIGHDLRSEQVIHHLWKRLRLPKKYLQAGKVAGRWHMVGAQYALLRPGKKVDLLLTLHTKGLLKAFFALVKADHGLDYLSQAQQDLDTILSVHLPPDCPYHGPEAGNHLRGLRAQALASG